MTRDGDWSLADARELVAGGLPTRTAVARGITESAGTVTSAAVEQSTAPAQETR